MTARSVPEWIGKTPDTKVPARVRLRIFENHGGICHISKRKIGPSDLWDLDHVIPLKDGGEHRETNMRPGIREAHRLKTAHENADRAIANRKRRKAIGIRPTARNPIMGSVASGWKNSFNGWVKR
jgi:5-methylcytosine-specific restriction endonuclease McrA